MYEWNRYTYVFSRRRENRVVEKARFILFELFRSPAEESILQVARRAIFISPSVSCFLFASFPL